MGAIQMQGLQENVDTKGVFLWDLAMLVRLGQGFFILEIFDSLKRKILTV